MNADDAGNVDDEMIIVVMLMMSMIMIMVIKVI